MEGTQGRGNFFGRVEEVRLKKFKIQNEMRGVAWNHPFSFLIPRFLFPAILGMYTLMSNKQYYDAICSGEICNTEGISSEYVREHGSQGSWQAVPESEER